MAGKGMQVEVDESVLQKHLVALNQAIKRNPDKFPDDSCFRLTSQERDELVTVCDRFRKLKHSSMMPRAFTEHGTLMAANVLSSPRAVEVSIFVVRAFVRMRDMAVTNVRIAREIQKLRDRIDVHDESIKTAIHFTPVTRRRNIAA